MLRVDAAKLAGLNVLGLIHNHAAAALQYGIERDFTNRTERVLFYDMGSGTTEAALVKFSSYTDKKVGLLGRQEGGRRVSPQADLGMCVMVCRTLV